MSLTNDHDPYLACAGKQQFDNRADARRAAIRVRKGAAWNEYRCEHCGFFHIGSRTKAPPPGRVYRIGHGEIRRGARK